jgi:hypothetical protein
MTTAQNPVSVIDHEYLPQSIVVTSNLSINEGDLVFWDGVNFTATALTKPGQVASGGESNSKGLLGVAAGSNQPEVYGGDAALPQIPVLAKATCFFNTTAAEKYNHFDFVTVGADSQTILKSGATEANAVGVIILDPPAEARPSQATPVPEEVEGGTGVRVRVLLIPKHIAAKSI